MPDLASLPLGASIAVFAAAGAVILAAGVRMSRLADRLADRTGLGEAVVGSLVLAASTSLPDFAATLAAAVGSRPELAMANVMGSMAANLAFLGIADAVYRKANLEHAAASAANLMQAALLVALLALLLLAMAGPAMTVLGVHPVTPLLAALYLFGFRLVRHAQTAPMWEARQTRETVRDVPDRGSGRGRAGALWLRFAGLAALTAAAGWLLMGSAAVIADATGVSETAAGALLTAVTTSLPELVTTISAVRHGALTLAVGNIVGTNAFNTLAAALADVAYPGGSIYHAVTSAQVLWGLLTVLMTAVLLMGFVRRERYGPANIGFESVLILVLYLAAAGLTLAAG